MALLKKKPAPTKKAYFIKGELPFNGFHRLEDGKHNKCGGKPEWVNKTKAVLHCTKCRKEFFLKGSLHHNIGPHFYIETKVPIDLDKLEPVFRSVDKTEGNKMYSTWVPLAGKDLAKYHYRGKEIIEEDVPETLTVPNRT